jgi:hypothetical protein
MATDLSPNLFDHQIIKRDTTFNLTTFKYLPKAAYCLSGLQKIPVGKTIRIGGLASYQDKYIVFYTGNEQLIKNGDGSIFNVQISSNYQPIVPPKYAEFAQFIVQTMNESVYFENIYLGDSTDINFSATDDTTGSINVGAVNDLIAAALETNAIYFDSTHFSGDGSFANPFRVIGSVGGGGTSPGTGTTSDVTFANPFVVTDTTWTNGSGVSYHQHVAGNKTLGSTKSGRLYSTVSSDSDFIFGYASDSNADYENMNFAFQLSTFQGNIRLFKWISGVQELVKNTNASYVGIFRDSTNSVIIQESYDGVEWNDLLTLGTLTGVVSTVLSMNGAGKIIGPKITIF